MKTTGKFFTIIAAGLLMASCVVGTGKTIDYGEVKTVDLHSDSIPYFNGINVKGVATVNLKQSDSLSIDIKAPEKIMEVLKVEVRGTTLFVEQEETAEFRDIQIKDVVVNVKCPDIKSLEVKGVGDINALNDIKTSRLFVEVKGVGDIDLRDVKCDTIECYLKGTGDIEMENIEATLAKIEVKGTGDAEVESVKSETLDLTNKGTGDIEIKKITSKVTNARNNGTGDMELNFENSEYANCSVTGTATTTLSGSLKKLDQDAGGVARIKTSELRLE